MGYEDSNPYKKLYLAYRFKAILPFLRYSWPNCEFLSPTRLWLTPIEKASMMIKKKILNPDRIRRIHGGFSFIPHRFLGDGFLASLQQKEILLYLFLVIAADRYGLSFYSYDAICTLLGLDLDQYINARDGLIDKELIAFNGTIFQVLDLPAKPVSPSARRQTDHRQTAPLTDIFRFAGQVVKRIPP
jgi:hypothetical protein